MYVAAIFLPLIGAVIAGLFGRRIGDRASMYITSGLLVVSAVLGGIILYQVGFAKTGPQEPIRLFTWMASGELSVDWALRFDTLAAVMVVVVTLVSAVVHVYSIGYMGHDPHKPRFFAYLSLFTFSMLMLVTAENFAQMFFGWEGVGLCSYLLIGFWYKRETANAAAIKAFLVNRIGDFGFALGIFAVFAIFGSLDFSTVLPAARELPGKEITTVGGYVIDGQTALDWTCILLFIGAMGKSAQILLHTWLPDAMEGPTPVSALIHAATMVTAGVFMVCRLSPMFEFAPLALAIVVTVGAFTAFFAATVGLVQNDIKRVIAYSTCSQLGYMFFAAGIGAYPVAMFHLMTHAFFKALLFLGSGSVIHGMSDEQDMRRMGGLWRKMTTTYVLMWIGSLALAGVGIPFVFGFAGFYSKDLILEAAFGAHTGLGLFAFWMGIAAAVMTAFYSWRLIIMSSCPSTARAAPRPRSRPTSTNRRRSCWRRCSCSRSARSLPARSPSAGSPAATGPASGAIRSTCGRTAQSWTPRIMCRPGSRFCPWSPGSAESGSPMRCTCCGRPGPRRWPSSSAASTISCSTSGISTSFSTGSSCVPP